MDKRPENEKNDQNLADPAAENVMLKSYHENQREQNQNYVQLNWVGEVT